MAKFNYMVGEKVVCMRTQYWPSIPKGMICTVAESKTWSIRVNKWKSWFYNENFIPVKDIISEQ